ncbi:MAG: KamA family radical SAM protein [Candidatus Eremiobacteraeota bacterium]|nr:KamA family radical SAM protein [Candidatus Eremiobacteraeota bacterium]
MARVRENSHGLCDADSFTPLDKLDFLNKALDIFPEIKSIMGRKSGVEEARGALLSLSYRIERGIESRDSMVHPLERISIKEALLVFRNFLSERNEERTGHQVLKTVFQALRSDEETLRGMSIDFIEELEHLLKALRGMSGQYSRDGLQGKEPAYLKLKGREAALARCRFLDGLSRYSEKYIYHKYPSGIEEHVAAARKENVRRILRFFSARQRDWNDYTWHLKHIVKDCSTLESLVELTGDEREAIEEARGKGIPFGITPYYVSLMDREPHRKFDHAVRAQVIPPLSYVKRFRHMDRREMDFMREQDTSPIDLVTRRYPMIAIFKPFNTCAQICVYCQRNWEIDEVNSPHALASSRQIDDAIEWFRVNDTVRAVLITGGDPLILPDAMLDELIGRLSAIPHIERIRLGTRTPVVLPMRFTGTLVKILKKYHSPGKKELCIVTHFEHPYEITPQAMEAVQRVKKSTSINFYNQQVFTIENSRRFETVALRRALKLMGVDPYYVFYAKGKKETEHYIVPIARLLQERKEEARLTPGVIRTDEPVYNIPGIGKNHLRAMQDHELIMLTPRGNRIYEMHPWEKAIVTSGTYLYEDVPLGSYLRRLAGRGEDTSEYGNLWYYY